MPRSVIPKEVAAVRKFAEVLDCHPDVILNIGSSIRRHRRWAVRRFADRLDEVLDELLPTDVEALRASMKIIKLRPD